MSSARNWRIIRRARRGGPKVHLSQRLPIVTTVRPSHVAARFSARYHPATAPTPPSKRNQTRAPAVTATAVTLGRRPQTPGPTENTRLAERDGTAAPSDLRGHHGDVREPGRQHPRRGLLLRPRLCRRPTGSRAVCQSASHTFRRAGEYFTTNQTFPQSTGRSSSNRRVDRAMTARTPLPATHP